ncbi:MAG: type I glyceraldehyde-3-phosphate dehydrogenase [Candidatus Diapherotrites archaeon]|nr:type I glyceraldehyde-3-phosphate dehydrogenase [Candidatus Diapherotrites archaeon]
MKKLRIAINGFGRIGRLFYRIALEHPNLEVVAANDLGLTPVLANLLKFDSVYGKFNHSISVQNETIQVDQHSIQFFHERDPVNLPWKNLDIDLVLDATSLFRKREQLEPHLKAGAKKVLIAVPPKDESIQQIVLCANKPVYDPKKHDIVSMASCTTNSAVPLALVLHKEFGIEKGFINTTHAVTMDQSLLDASNKDMRRARNSMLNIIPTSTGSAKAVGVVIPELKGKLNGVAMRVPISAGSITDLTVKLSKASTVEEVNQKFKHYAQTSLKGFLEYSEEELVSSDIVGNSNTCIFDSKQTMVIGDLVKVLGWYDNEFGYASKLADFADYILEQGF